MSEWKIYGGTDEQIEEMRRLVLPPDEQVAHIEEELSSMPEFGRSITLSIEFETVEKRDAAKALLKKLSDDHGKKPGAIVAEAMAGWAAAKGPRKRAKGKAA